MAARQIGRLGFGVTAAGLSVIALVVLIAARPIALAFTRDPALAAVTAAGLTLCTLFFVADGLQAVAAQALRAQSDILVPTSTHIVSYVVVMVPLAWWFALPMGQGLSGIIGAVLVASVLAAGSLTGRFFWITRPR